MRQQTQVLKLPFLELFLGLFLILLNALVLIRCIAGRVWVIARRTIIAALDAGRRAKSGYGRGLGGRRRSMTGSRCRCNTLSSRDVLLCRFEHDLRTSRNC